MLGRTACWKCLNDDSLNSEEEDGSGTQRSPASMKAIKNLSAQIQDMVLNVSGAHKPYTVSNLSHEGQLQRCLESEVGSESGKPNGGSSSCSTPAWSIINASSKGHVLGDINASTSRNGTPTIHTSSGAAEVIMEEEESKERISQVEPGVLITLVSLKEGGNELKRVRFSRELFSEWRAQCWWTENYDKVMTLYNVRAHAKNESVVVPTPRRSQDEEFSGAGEHVVEPMQNGSLLPGTSSSRDADRSEGLQSRDKLRGQEWVEEDEVGVYVIISCSPRGSRKIKRVKFSREKFSDMQATLWWEENRLRIHQKFI